MKIRFINAVCILALILASACKSDNASQLKDKEMMITEKKNIGSKLALYPMPVTVVGIGSLWRMSVLSGMTAFL